MNAPKRQHPRLAASFPVEFSLAGESVLHRGNTRDMSGGGLLLETKLELSDKRAVLAISFELRGMRVEARGRVVSSSYETASAMYRYRMVFTDISAEAQNLLAAYVLRNRLYAIALGAPAGTD